MGEHVTFHRDGEVSIQGVRVGTMKREAEDKWRFAPVDRPVIYGPYRCRSHFRNIAREAYRRIEKART